MKIGILTFHWATNYGAVLQTYALQEYLTIQGHEVEIINYKPKQYDFSWLTYVIKPYYLLKLKKDLIKRKKEKLLQCFRDEYLNQTKRFYTYNELKNSLLDYDVVISGSDQILNPFFTMKGESQPTPTYYLNFLPQTIRKIGYAVSFGCTLYPDYAIEQAKKWITNFDSIGVRENSGKDVLKQLKYEERVSVVPDPTILMGKRLFEKIRIDDRLLKNDYICVYMLRTRISIDYPDLYYIDDLNNPISLESWLEKISHSKGLITNSYHGMIMSILFHIPFVVLLESKEGVGMNDRFSTLLNAIGLEGRIVNDCDLKLKLLEPIDWSMVDGKLADYSMQGDLFLSKYI